MPVEDWRKQLEDAETTAGRERAAALVGRGLTPRVVRDLVCFPPQRQRTCRALGVDDADID